MPSDQAKNLEEAKKAGHLFGRFDITRAARSHRVSRLLLAHHEHHEDVRELIVERFRSKGHSLHMVSGGEALDESEVQAFADGYMIGALERIHELATKERIEA